MMSYRYDRKKRSQQRWYLGIIVLLLLGLFTSVYSWLFNVIEKPLARSWENKQEFFDGTENFFESFYAKSRILEKNKELEQEIKRLEIDNMRTRYLSEELERIYNFRTSDSTLAIARVLSHGTRGASDTLIVNQGAQHGVSTGDQVFAYENIVLGYISQVYDVTSRVTLYSQIEQFIDGVLFPHNINLTATGNGKGSFVIEVPREIKVVEGDIFYSLEKPGNIIGIVRTVEFDPRDPFKSVYISYSTNMNQIQNIGIKKQTPISISE